MHFCYKKCMTLAAQTLAAQRVDGTMFPMGDHSISIILVNRQHLKIYTREHCYTFLPLQRGDPLAGGLEKQIKTIELRSLLIHLGGFSFDPTFCTQMLSKMYHTVRKIYQLCMRPAIHTGSPSSGLLVSPYSFKTPPSHSTKSEYLVLSEATGYSARVLLQHKYIDNTKPMHAVFHFGIVHA